MRLRPALACLAVLSFAIPEGAAEAQTLLAGPGEDGHDAELLERAEGWVRLQQGVLSVPFGFGLEAYVSDADARDDLEDFVASGELDVEAATGRHPYELVDRYDEQGDLGMFGGVQAAGDAFRYVVLREAGAPESVLAPARAALVRTADGLHWQTAITGVPGVVARGITRITPADGDPPLPDAPPVTLPLFDAGGDPQPAEKTPTWRDDASGELPFLAWLDDCSKDQLDGYVFALGALYDALSDDPAFDPMLLARLVADARAIGASLMVERVVNADGDRLDLVIVDADGRPTTFHDLNPVEISPGVTFTRPINGFNSLMALGTVRTLYHITGDAALGRFYYEQLIGARDYLRTTQGTLRAMYVSTMTNFSNVNMAFVASWGVLRFETDPVVRREMVEILESELYAPGVDREARRVGLPFFDFIYAGFGGGDAVQAASAVGRGALTLSEFPEAPVWNPAVVNCDAAELAARSCLAIDDETTITLAATAGRNGIPVAVDPVPMRLRPPSNFEHRSDPYRVNDEASDRLNPAGSVHAAYWMGRLLSVDAADNVSPHARPALPWTAAGDRDGGVPGGDAGPGGGEPSGCACQIGAARPFLGARSGLALFSALAFAVRRARRIRE